MNRFENGFHSFKKAIEMLGENRDDEYALKDLLIAFHHSIEVLFKHILCEKNSSLMYSDIDKYINNIFYERCKSNSNNENPLHSINFMEAIRRVCVVYNHTIDLRVYNQFVKINSLRNNLTHDEMKLNNEIKQLIVSILPFVILILKEHLSDVDRKTFNDYIDSQQTVLILNRLYDNNDIWKIISLISLINYEKAHDDMVNSDLERNYEKMLEMLGYYIEKNDVLGLFVNEDYYLSPNLFLESELANYMAYRTSLICNEIKSNEDFKTLFNKDSCSIEIFIKYIQCLINEVLTLLSPVEYEECELNEIDSKIHNYLSSISLSNKLDIYELLYHIKSSFNSYNSIFEKCRDEDIIKKCGIKNYNIVHKALLSWYKDNNWYNEFNAKGISSKFLYLFKSSSQKYDVVMDKIIEKISDEVIYDDLIGRYGNIGTIDLIDATGCDPEVKFAITDIDNNVEKCTLILRNTLSTETYLDGEYYYGGSVDVYVAVVIDENDNIISEYFIEDCMISDKVKRLLNM